MKQVLLVSCLLFFGINLAGQNARVVGYLPTYRFSSSDQIEYCKLTHLNLSFANPDSGGNIVMTDISAVMSDALSDNPDIVICISMGGGALSVEQADDWSNLIDIPANRPAFITKIVDYVLTNNLDGIDMDLEWGHVTPGYSGFITELDTALTSHNKMLTAAFPNQTKFSNVSSAALEAFDFINIMSYDAKGPWAPSSPGQHSSYSFSTFGVNFWKNSIGISGDGLNLGVPFYGYDFVDISTVNAVSYAGMVAANVSNSELDQVGTAYYNGRPTIEAKVELAKNEIGGIMIWELGQDSFDEYSLLKTIHDKYTSLKIITTGLCGNVFGSSIPEPEAFDKHIIYPNPSTGSLTIKHEYFKHPKVIITNTLGQIASAEAIQKNNYELYFNLENFSSGIYFITIISETCMPTTHKLILK
ncbi:glycosyl hydrolase family 18 protein [Bacteroidota bacterium]